MTLSPRTVPTILLHTTLAPQNYRICVSLQGLWPLIGADCKSQEGPYHLIAPCLGTPESVISLEHASIMALRREQILSPGRAPTISIAPHFGTPELTI